MSVTITNFGIGSSKISTRDMNIYVDSFIADGFNLDFDYSDATHILVTHGHNDHFDPVNLAKAAKETGALVIGPPIISFPLLVVESLPSEQLLVLYDENENHKSFYHNSNIEIKAHPSRHFFDECKYSVHNSYLMKLYDQYIYINGDSLEFHLDKFDNKLDAIIYNFVIPDKNVDAINNLIKENNRFKPKAFIINHIIDCDWTIDAKEISSFLSNEDNKNIKVLSKESNSITIN